MHKDFPRSGHITGFDSRITRKLNDKYMARNPQHEILAYLLKGGRLTVQKAWRMFETSELRRIVSRLKRNGHPIAYAWQYDMTKTGRRVKFKEYFIEKAPGALQ